MRRIASFASPTDDATQGERDAAASDRRSSSGGSPRKAAHSPGQRPRLAFARRLFNTRRASAAARRWPRGRGCCQCPRRPSQRWRCAVGGAQETRRQVRRNFPCRAGDESRRTCCRRESRRARARPAPLRSGWGRRARVVSFAVTARVHAGEGTPSNRRTRVQQPKSSRWSMGAHLGRIHTLVALLEDDVRHLVAPPKRSDDLATIVRDHRHDSCTAGGNISAARTVCRRLIHSRELASSQDSVSYMLGTPLLASVVKEHRDE